LYLGGHDGYRLALFPDADPFVGSVVVYVPKDLFMMTQQKKPRTYKVAVYFRDDDGVWHHHGTWDGEAVSPFDAKCQAIKELSDVRIEGWRADILAATPPSRNES
jgi:hypothetical protein